MKAYCKIIDAMGREKWIEVDCPKENIDYNDVVDSPESEVEARRRWC
jgi:hypothetical protein